MGIVVVKGWPRTDAPRPHNRRSPDTVVRTLEAYQKAGVETFILSGMPLLEEACRFGEKVLPRLDVAREVSAARHFTWSMLLDRDLSTVRTV